MPKPELQEIRGAYEAWTHNGGTWLALVDRVSAVWSEAWDRDREETAQPSLMTTDSGEEWLRNEGTSAEDFEAYNELMRLCRHGYEQAMLAHGVVLPSAGRVVRDIAVRQSAAKAFPLRKRVPRVVKDPHGERGEWSMGEDGSILWRGTARGGWLSSVGMPTTPERVRLLSDLLSNPYEWVEDTEPETDPNFAMGA